MPQWLRKTAYIAPFPNYDEKKESQPTSDLPWIDPSILSIFKGEDENKEQKDPSSDGPYMVSFDLSWYRPWLAEQISNLPNCLTKLLSKDGALNTIDLTTDTPFYRFFMIIRQYTSKAERSLTIDEIIKYLGDDLAQESLVQTENVPELKHLVFAILGWQSMLYRPSFNTCPLSQFAVHQEVDQPDSGLIFDTYKLSAYLSDRPVAILLKTYGHLLPARAREPTLAVSEDGSAWNPLNPSEMNAHFLHTILQIEIRWVDTLSLHLDYDKSTRTLSIFRYPSFCLAMLHSKGTVYAFEDRDKISIDRRANYDEITDILHETLLSYRLLFGQSKKSRKVFRNHLKSNPSLSHNPDSLLKLMCGHKNFAHEYVPGDRPIYFAPRDFPTLSKRVELIGAAMRGAKPKDWKSLLRDRRDTTQYWTFWLVAIIGGTSIVLSLIQVILQGVQIRQESS